MNVISPLSTSLISLTPIGIGILLYGLLFPGISCLTSINFIDTIINVRCYSTILTITPVYTWSRNITGFLLLFTLPILTGDLIMSLEDLRCNAVFFNPIIHNILNRMNLISNRSLISHIPNAKRLFKARHD